MKNQTANNVRSEVNDAAESVKSIVHDNLSEKVGQFADKFSETKSQLMDVARDELAELNKVSEQVAEQASAFAKKAEAAIKEHPILAAVAAASVGALVVGAVFKAFSSSSKA